MDGLSSALNVVTFILLTGSITLWLLLGMQRRRFFALRWLQRPSGPPKMVWGLADLFVMFVILVVVQTAAILMVTPAATGDAESAGEVETRGNAEPSDDSTSSANETETGSEDEAASDSQDDRNTPSQNPALAMFVAGIAELIALAAMWTWLYARYRIALPEIGIEPKRVSQDVYLGLTASVMILPPVVGLQSILTRLIPYTHDTMNQVIESQSASIVAAAFVSAGIGAPLLEEFLYRLFLQGWLMRLVDGFSSVLKAQKNNSEMDQVATLLIGGRTVEQEQWSESESGDEKQSAKSPSKNRVPWWLMLFPIISSSALFALAHFGQGPAPISLFFFAFAVGGLFALTHRIIPCIVVHMALNFWSLTLLALAVFVGNAPN